MRHKKSLVLGQISSSRKPTKNHNKPILSNGIFLKASSLPFSQKSKSSSKFNSSNFRLNSNTLSNPRYYKYFTIGIFAFLLAIISSAALIPISNSNAESSVGTLTEATG
ncbi:hypothetical protein IJ096_02310, partial [Candidatus Saccharibacteria bacterium]|nr:hypothetical protein [Candidatus Saccharibacteria bacterium]